MQAVIVSEKRNSANDGFGDGEGRKILNGK